MGKRWIVLWGVSLLVVVIAVFLLVVQKDDNGVTTQPNHKPTIVTTIYPIYYLTKEIVGGKVEVERLIKPGESIHSFSPTPKNMVTLTKAKIFVSLGGSLEPWANKLAAATNVKLLQLDKVLTLRKDTDHSGDAHEEHDHDHKHEHGDEPNQFQNDPHVWQSFENSQKIVETLMRELSTLYPQFKKDFEVNAAKLLVKLYRLSDLYGHALDQCKKKTILVGHDAFGYLKDAYGFETQSITGAYDNAAPNAAKIAQLSDLITKEDIKILFYEPLDSNKNAKQLAHDRNLSLLPLYALGNISLEDETQGEDFITLLQFNLTQLKKGLECQ